jgi:hypothetical protein
VRLPGYDRWARQDPRGNKPGVDAQFSLAEERIAWVPCFELGERDYRQSSVAEPPPRRLRVHALGFRPLGQIHDHDSTGRSPMTANNHSYVTRKSAVRTPPCMRLRRRMY